MQQRLDGTRNGGGPGTQQKPEDADSIVSACNAFLTQMEQVVHSLGTSRPLHQRLLQEGINELREQLAQLRNSKATEARMKNTGYLKEAKDEFLKIVGLHRVIEITLDGIRDLLDRL